MFPHHLFIFRFLSCAAAKVYRIHMYDFVRCTVRLLWWGSKPPSRSGMCCLMVRSFSDRAVTRRPYLFSVKTLAAYAHQVPFKHTVHILHPQTGLTIIALQDSRLLNHGPVGHSEGRERREAQRGERKPGETQRGAR